MDVCVPLACVGLPGTGLKEVVSLYDDVGNQTQVLHRRSKFSLPAEPSLQFQFSWFEDQAVPSAQDNHEVAAAERSLSCFG